MKFEVTIHGIDVADREYAAALMNDCLKRAAQSLVLGYPKTLFNARGTFDSDIEVELVESAGSTKDVQPDSRL